MPDLPRTRRALWLWLALAGEVLFFLGHGALLTASDPAHALLGAVAGSVSIVLAAGIAAGVDGLRPQALLPPLLLAASPGFAHAAFTNGATAVLAALLLAAGYRAFAETHTHGRIPISALFGGLAAATGPSGFLALIALFLQRLLFARKFRLPRAVVVFAVVWLGLALAVAGGARLVLGDRVMPGAGALPWPIDESLLTSAMRVVRAFIRAVNGLALLPFVLALILAWKPKEIYFRLTVAALVLIALLVAAVRVPAAGLELALAPALPWAFLIAGEALAHAATVLEGSGLRGRAGAILGASVIAALVLAELAPTLANVLQSP